MWSFSNILKDVFRSTKTFHGLAVLFKAIIVICFVLGQLNSSAHAHGHEHEEEPHKSHCAFCILTLQDEESEGDETDLPDMSNGPDVLISKNATLLNRDENLSATYVSEYNPGSARCAFHKSDAARAPPFI